LRCAESLDIHNYDDCAESLDIGYIPMTTHLCTGI